MQNTIIFLKKKVQENVYSRNINVILGRLQEFTIIICRVTNIFLLKCCKCLGYLPCLYRAFAKNIVFAFQTQIILLVADQNIRFLNPETPVL